MQPPPAPGASAMGAVIDLQFAHQSQLQVPTEQDFQRWVDAALTHLSIKQAELTIRTVDAAESQQLNLAYRGKDKPTNVLSFPFDADIPLPVPLLGDLVICVPIMEDEAAAQHKPLQHHFAHLVVHGTLHLLGYDHIEEVDAEHMEQLEVDILQRIGIPNPYHMESN